MRSPDEIDRLLTSCESQAELLRSLNSNHPLLEYDFDTVSTQAEKEALKKRFFESFGPTTVTRESIGEVVYILLSLDKLLCELTTAVVIEKMRRGLL